MGGKFGERNTVATRMAEVRSFVEGIPAEHRDLFDTLRSLIHALAPQAQELCKWGTLHFDQKGSLFALSSAKGKVQFYVLSIGLLARHQAELGHLEQGKCVLRLEPSAELPLEAIRTLIREAVAPKS